MLLIPVNHSRRWLAGQSRCIERVAYPCKVRGDFARATRATTGSQTALSEARFTDELDERVCPYTLRSHLQLRIAVLHRNTAIADTWCAKSRHRLTRRSTVTRRKLRAGELWRYVSAHTPHDEPKLYSTPGSVSGVHLLLSKDQPSSSCGGRHSEVLHRISAIGSPDGAFAGGWRPYRTHPWPS